MARIVICGGSLVGSAAAMMLARDGHDVLVIEAGRAPLPDDSRQAWRSWDRREVPQFRGPHALQPRARHVLDRELPDMIGRLLEAGCIWWDLLDVHAPMLQVPRRPDDDRFRSVTGRRPVLEWVFAAAARDHHRVEFRRGVRLAGLLTGAPALPGVPHVVGVRTTDGEEIHADLIIDAMGRATPSGRWLASMSARPPAVESTECGFVYYTRYFTGDLPARRAPVHTPLGTYSLVTLPSDNRTWSVTVVAATGDAPLKSLRDPDRFTALLRACPLHAHWLDGHPITEVVPFAGILDRYRHFVADGRPVVTGLLPVGDAWACTNPSAGRGISLGLLHAQILRGLMRDHLAHPLELVSAWATATDTWVTPFYRHQIAADRARVAEMNALRQGRATPPSTTPMAALLAAMAHDPAAVRAVAAIMACLALPEDLLTRPDVAQAIEHAPIGPRPFPGPDRGQLLALLS